MSKRMLVESLKEKVLETIERTDHLVGLVPAGRLQWFPQVPGGQNETLDLGHLLGHLLSCMAGFCAAFHASFPEKISGLAELRILPVDHFCTPGEARERLASYSAGILQGFDYCSDEDLERKVPTVFVPKGETLLTILLGNLEHLVNHKYQLFFYLKLLGVKVGTHDLYKLRGAGKQDDFLRS